MATTTAHNEAELMRVCGPLYLPIALESFATTVMCLAFGYLLLLITNKGRLQNPGRAGWLIVKKNVGSFAKDLWNELTKWPTMASAPLEQRFAFCRKANQAVCMSQLVIGVLTIERWLHINNVNGFRYLGYSVTCPPMMAEMVILIAPVMPCFKLVTIFTYVNTFAMLITGYIASVMSGDFFLGNLDTFFSSWDLGDLQPTVKLWMATISTAILVFLAFIQLPLLALVYLIKGGVEAGLPYGYLRLLTIVIASWCAFPVWWCFSYEGMALIKDTKANAIVFAILNIVAKGSFTLQMLTMTKWHRREKLRKECLEMGMQPRPRAGSSLFATDPERSPANMEAYSKGGRELRRSETWVVQMLRPYDKDAECSKDWNALEATFRAFLVGHGITPAQWDSLNADQQSVRRAEFDESMDMVLGVQNAPPSSKSQRGASVKHPPVAQTSAGRSSPATGLPRPGQLVTMAAGKKGRVVRVMKDNMVQVTVKGREPVTLCASSLITVQATFLHVRGLQKTSLATNAQLHCSALVDGLPASEVLTMARSCGGSNRVKWDEEVKVHGFDPAEQGTDKMTFRLWSSSPDGGSEDLLGEVHLGGHSLLEAGFDGELPLSLDGQQTQLYLGLMIVPMDSPVQPTESEVAQTPAAVGDMMVL